MSNDIHHDPAEFPWDTFGAVALHMAVLHHGFTSQSPHSRPPRIETVLATAEEFHTFLVRTSKGENH